MYQLLIKKHPYNCEWQMKGKPTSDFKKLQTMAEYYVLTHAACIAHEEMFAACILDMDWERPVYLLWEHFSAAIPAE